MRVPACYLVLCAATAFGQNLPEGLLPPADPTVTKSALPSMPRGKSTVMGGTIDKVDLVRDQFALKVAGGHSLKILFDERTQVFQDGKKISVLGLSSADHASVETTLDGTAIFALRIHILSALPDGQLHGQVNAYDPKKGELTLHVKDSNSTVTLTVPPGTAVVRVGQDAFVQQPGGTADLMQGTLVEATFKAGKSGTGEATRINILAVPGAEFMITGNLSSLDLRAGRMSITDASENPPMDVAFEPARFEVSNELHQGSAVKVKTRFDGTRYIATDISAQ